MSDLERITGLIGEIYAAALDGNLWPQVLRHMMMLLHGVSAAIFSDSELSNDRLCYEVAVEPAFTESCVRLLAPHLQRALAIARALERSESKSAALGEVLERLSSAVIFVDRQGRLVHANDPAARMLSTNDVLRWSGGKPRPRDERAAAHLEAILASAHPGHPPAGCCVLSVPHCAQGGERMMVHVLPLSAGTRRHVTGPRAAAAAIIVSQQTWDLPQRLQSAARLYALTPAESRVLGVLLTGCTIGGAAKALGIKEATVKTHLQHVFDKTGTRRQVDLAQRIADCDRSSLGRTAAAEVKLSTGALE
ncbi:MAG TPA: helix-turn-helix transcriptional regulator [Steroidobacteraceae bacterium]|nr:helix-turn-helix transcriptional regulator [Steroidobacteraceae bacterium]